MSFFEPTLHPDKIWKSCILSAYSRYKPISTLTPINMEQNTFIANLLECWVLDVSFLFQILWTCEINNIYIDTQDVIANYGGLHVNYFIYEWLHQLAESFLKSSKTQIEELLNIWDLDRYSEDQGIYDIFTNYIDSHIWFRNELIQWLFENSSFYYR